MRPLALAALLALTGQAAAQCPSHEALKAGGTAFATYPDTGTVELRWMGAGMVRETTRYPDGSNEFRMISMGGVFIIDEVDMDGSKELSSTRIVTRYPPDLYDRLPVRPESEMSVTAVNSFADGTEAEEEHIELRSGELAQVFIAGCAYEGFPMHITYHWGANEYFTSMMTHLPALGISLEVARMDQGEAPLPFAPERFSLYPPD